MGMILPGSGFGGSNYRPPTAAKSPEEEAATQEWTAQGQNVAADTTRANAGRTATAGAADRALTDFNAGGPTNTRAYAPLNLEGYNPNQVAQWQTAAANLQSPIAGGRSALAGIGAGELGKYGSKELTAFNANDVSGFDPSAYGKEFAGGAESEFQTNLGTSLDQLEKQGVGAGRLKTGFFTRDQGDVATRLGTDFNAKIAQEAGVFSGQRLDALKSGAGLRLSRAQGIDQNMLSRAQGIDTNAIAAGEGQDRYAIAGAGDATERARLGLTAATTADTLGMDRAKSLDTLGMERANFLDTQGLTRSTTGLDAALARESRYMSDAQTTADRASDYTSATRDWATQDRNAADTRAATAEANRQRQAELDRIAARDQADWGAQWATKSAQERSPYWQR